MSVHSLDKDKIEAMEVKISVRNLDILNSKSPTDRIVDNFSQWIQKSNNIFNCWLQINFLSRILSMHSLLLTTRGHSLTTWTPAPH